MHLEKKLKMKSKLFPFIGPIGILLLWSALSIFKIINPILFPPPHKVLLSLFKNLKDFLFWKNVLYTLYIWTFGSSIGIITAILFGLLIGYFKLLYSSLEFLIDFIKSLPSLLIYPIFLLLFGLTNLTKIAIVIWGVFFYMAINTIYGVKNAKKSYEETAKIYKINNKTKFIKIIFPAALPDIFVGIRLAISIGLILAIGAELILGTKFGIGRIVLESLLVYDMPRLYSIMLITGSLGYLASKTSVFIEDRILHWRGK